MKDTKIMLGCILTYILTWLLLALVCYFVTSYSFKACLSNGVVVFFQIITGWIPCVFVGCDMYQSLYRGETAHKKSQSFEIERPVNRFRVV